MSEKTPKKTAVTDPLEASKISVKPPPEPPAPKEPVKEFLPDPTAPADIHPPSASKKYKVKETTTISILGQITKLNKDDIVSESSYGPEGMARILTSNVPLEELKS